jgi:hypothetical protein
MEELPTENVSPRLADAAGRKKGGLLERCGEIPSPLAEEG